MTTGNADRIAAWFAGHADGEFVLAERGDAYTIDGSSDSIAPIIYTTKPSVLAVLIQRSIVHSVASIGRYGLPHKEDVIRLEQIARGRTLGFLGDADPVDLLIYTWLRERISLAYLGVNDHLLGLVGCPIDQSTTITLADSESLAIPLLIDACPDYRKLLGVKCARLLESRTKLELESVVSFGRANKVSLLST
jgi:hypothetical protein